MEKYTPSQIFMKFYRNKKFGISLQLVEKNRRFNRSLKSLQSIYSGQPIVSEYLSLPKSIRFLIKLSQKINAEEDKDIRCRNYPTEEFDNFGECDSNYVRKELEENFMGLRPFWASNMENITRLR